MRKGWVALGLMLATASYALAEDITLTGYYPSPRGYYRMLRTTNSTLLATDGGQVGIGTTNPVMRLHAEGPTTFQGQLRISGGGPAPDLFLVCQDGGGNAIWSGITGTFSYF